MIKEPESRIGLSLFNSLDSLKVADTLFGNNTFIKINVEQDFKHNLFYYISLYIDVNKHGIPRRHIILDIVENDDIFIEAKIQFTVYKEQKKLLKSGTIKKYKWEQVGSVHNNMTIRFDVDNDKQIYELMEVFEIM